MHLRQRPRALAFQLRHSRVPVALPNLIQQPHEPRVPLPEHLRETRSSRGGKVRWQVCTCRATAAEQHTSRRSLGRASRVSCKHRRATTVEFLGLGGRRSPFCRMRTPYTPNADPGRAFVSSTRCSSHDFHAGHWKVNPRFRNTLLFMPLCHLVSIGGNLSVATRSAVTGGLVAVQVMVPSTLAPRRRSSSPVADGASEIANHTAAYSTSRAQNPGWAPSVLQCRRPKSRAKAGGPALEVIAGENQLDAAKRRWVAHEAPCHQFEFIEQLAGDHADLVNDQDLRIWSKSKLHRSGVHCFDKRLCIYVAAVEDSAINISSLEPRSGSGRH